MVFGEGDDTIVDLGKSLAAGGDGDALALADVIDANGDATVDVDDLLFMESNGLLSVTETGDDVVMEFNGSGSVMLQGLADGSINSVQSLLDAGYEVTVTG